MPQFVKRTKLQQAKAVERYKARQAKKRQGTNKGSRQQKTKGSWLNQGMEAHLMNMKRRSFLKGLVSGAAYIIVPKYPDTYIGKGDILVPNPEWNNAHYGIVQWKSEAVFGFASSQEPIVHVIYRRNKFDAK